MIFDCKPNFITFSLIDKMEDIKISQIIQKFESAATNFQKRINPKTLNIAYRNGSMVVIAALSSPPRIRFDLNEGIDFGLIYLHPPERQRFSV